MNNTVLQIPIDKNIRNQAAAFAEKMGFSSLQEVVRLFLNRVAAGEINVSFEPTVKLSAKNDKRYAKIIDEIKSGKAKTKTFNDTESLINYLNSEN